MQSILENLTGMQCLRGRSSSYYSVSAIMSSILSAIFKCTVGLLVNKARDKIAERLKDGDVTGEAFRGLVIRELDDIKTTLKGLARKDLLTSMEFFKEGILNLNQVFEKSTASTDRSRQGMAATAADASSSTQLTTSIVTKQLQHDLELTYLDDSANAEDRFRSAREEATRAFSNEALSTSDRILALNSAHGDNPGAH